MSAVRCEDCGAVWLTPAARDLMADSHGCLRCDGGLREMSDQEVDDYLREPLPE